MYNTIFTKQHLLFSSYTKTCSAISCCLDLETLVRTFYFDEFLKSLKNLNKTNLAEQLPQHHSAVLEDHFKITRIQVLNEDPIIQDNIIIVELKLESNFPREIVADCISISYDMTPKSATDVAKYEDKTMLPISVHLDYKQDNTLSSASVVCDVKSNKSALRRSSSVKRKISPTARSDFTNCVTIENCVIKPGSNIIELKAKATRVGIWLLKQLSLQIQQLDFLSETLPFKVKPFEVTTKPSSAVLSFMNLIAGLEQEIKLIVSGGSFVFPTESSITLRCAKNLKLKEKDKPNVEYKRELSIDLSHFQSFEERTFNLKAVCELPGRREEKPIEQKVSLQCPWSRSEIQIPLHFLPALIASCRLHSSGTKKFLQVVIKGVCESKLILSNPTMKCASMGVTLHDLNPKSQIEIPIQKSLTVSFLWEIQVEPLKTENELPTIQIEFGMNYAPFDNTNSRRQYSCTFDVSDYTTLFRIQAKIEPSELCRVGSVCHLNLRITKVQENPFTDLMYEVLTDQNTWAVCGRSAGKLL